MNNYSILYDKLIENARNIDVAGGQVHHIIPRSIWRHSGVSGDMNDASNLIRLTDRDHYTAHWCLYMIHKDDPVKGPPMAKAYRFMKALGRLSKTMTSVDELVAYGNSKGISVAISAKIKC